MTILGISLPLITLRLFPGVVEAVARLNRAGGRLVLVTNQSAIARGNDDGRGTFLRS